MAPFDDPKVRKAIAAALPYEDMFKATIFGRGKQASTAPTWTRRPAGQRSFPQADAQPHRPRAGQEAARRGRAPPTGFSTTFAFSAGQAATAEPMAALRQGSRSPRWAYTVEIQKKPDAEFNTLESDKKMPFFTDAATAWLPFTYYFFYLYFTRDQRWNFSSLEERRAWRDLTQRRPLPNRPGRSTTRTARR